MSFERYNFDDVVPMPVASEESDVKDVVLCKIMYSENFLKVFGYLRALMEKNELSKRALSVACEAISIVPAHYTVWTYKFEIVKHLISNGEYDIKEELDWCSDIALNNEKNYQIWRYREMVIELYIKTKCGGDKSKYNLESEYEIVHEMLVRDEKNYHVWSHKRWIVEYMNLFNDKREYEFVEKMILDDVRNNSAWNFRYFVVFGLKNTGLRVDDTLIENEIRYTIERINVSITNPSSWNYLKALYRMLDKSKLATCPLFAMIHQTVVQYSDISNVELALNEDRLSVPAVELLADIQGDQQQSSEQQHTYQLLQTLDPVRHNYWKHRAESL